LWGAKHFLVSLFSVAALFIFLISWEARCDEGDEQGKNAIVQWLHILPCQRGFYLTRFDFWTLAACLFVWELVHNQLLVNFTERWVLVFLLLTWGMVGFLGLMVGVEAFVAGSIQLAILIHLLLLCSRLLNCPKDDVVDDDGDDEEGGGESGDDDERGGVGDDEELVGGGGGDKGGDLENQAQWAQARDHLRLLPMHRPAPRRPRTRSTKKKKDARQ
jgi:hypothetical protein